MIDSRYQIADELRGFANLGLRFIQDNYDRVRYQTILAASARIVAALEGRSQFARSIFFKQPREEVPVPHFDCKSL